MGEHGGGLAWLTAVAAVKLGCVWVLPPTSSVCPLAQARYGELLGKVSPASFGAARTADGAARMHAAHACCPCNQAKSLHTSSHHRRAPTCTVLHFQPRETLKIIGPKSPCQG